MRVIPLLVDSVPPYARNAPTPTSLLLTPLGDGTVLSHLQSWLAAIDHSTPSVVATFEPAAGYERAIRDGSLGVDSVFEQSNLITRLGAYEASDWLLVLDPACFPAGAVDPEDLFDAPKTGPHWAKHLVALEANVAGTKEYVESDTDGRVRRIQRYYQSVTWPFTKGISCSLLPMSCVLLARDLPVTCLPELRRALASRGIPSRDLPLVRGAYDLTEERGLLALNERVVLQGSGGRASTVAKDGCRVDPTAKLLGPVVLQAGVEIQEGATVIGPSVIGSGSVVERNAIVAQCLVGQNSRVAPGTTVRHRVLFGDVAAAEGDSPAAHLAPSAIDGRSTGPFELSYEPPANPSYATIKRYVEMMIALVALIALSPLLLLVAVGIKLGSRGPVLYGDEREGKGGRFFRCWKFRTMVEGAHAKQRRLADQSQVDGPQFKMAVDPRLTRLGRLLRATNIDELPQLFNVVRGSMSLVGPRPSPFRENQLCIPWREARLSVRPGITGLWQVCRHERSKGDFHQWIYFDLLYVRHQSLGMDLRVLAATAFTLGGKTHVPVSWIVAPHNYYERRRSPRPPGSAEPRPQTLAS